MGAVVKIQGFPHILRLSFTQCSDARAGRCIVDTTVDTEQGITQMPRSSTLTINTDNFSGMWSDMRIVKTSRIRYGRMRTVLEDSRWKLQETRMTKNFNERNDLGKVLTSTEKTIPELCEEIARDAQINIFCGEVPDIRPPAKWANRTAEDCMQEMLELSGCRMVYDPTFMQYVVSAADSGQEINEENRIYRPEPNAKFQKVTFRSHPIYFEDTVDCSAVEIDTSSGEAVEISDENLPTSPTSAGGQTRYRLWKPSSVSHPEGASLDDCLFLDRRAKSHMFDPKSHRYEKARIVRDEYQRHPVHVPLVLSQENTVRAIELTGGGRAFLTDHPVMTGDGGGGLLKSCKLVTSYHVAKPDEPEEEGDEGTQRKRFVCEEVSVSTGGQEGEKVVNLDWIKPVNSLVGDMDDPEWDTVLGEFASAISKAYIGKTGTMVCPSPFSLQGNGKVGAVKYLFKTGRRPKIKFSFAINFIPGSLGHVQ